MSDSKEQLVVPRSDCVLGGVAVPHGTDERFVDEHLVAAESVAPRGVLPHKEEVRGTRTATGLDLPVKLLCHLAHRSTRLLVLS